MSVSERDIKGLSLQDSLLHIRDLLTT